MKSANVKRMSAGTERCVPGPVLAGNSGLQRTGFSGTIGRDKERCMAAVYCLCGKTGSGKTEYARRLRASGKVVVMNIDDLMLTLFGEALDRTAFDEKLAVCLEYVCGLAAQVLDTGVSVVLDAGFWKKSQRRAVAERFIGRRVRFVYLKIGDVEQRRRIDIRNRASGQTGSITPARLADLNALFEPLVAAEEGIEVEVVPQDSDPTA
jgi:predicted kinase